MKKSSYLICVAAAAIVTVGSAATMQAQSFWVSSQGYTNAFTGIVNNYGWIGNPNGGTGRLQQGSYSIDATAAGSDDYCMNVPTGATYQCVNATESASASVVGSVAPGVVHVNAIANGTLTPNTVTDVHGIEQPNIGTGQGTVLADADWGDEVTFGGLPVGTPISVVFTLALDGSLGVIGDNYAPNAQDANTASFSAYLNNPVSTLSARGGDGFLSSYEGTPVGFPGGSYTATGTVLSGSTYDLSGGVNVYAVAAASSPTSPDVTSFVDAANTSQAFITLLTPGATFTSASGASYAPVTTTPEPPSLMLLGSALVFLAAAARRKLLAS